MQSISIYKVRELLCQVFDILIILMNIKSGLKKTEIFLFDKNNFTNEDVMPRATTNRPLNWNCIPCFAFTSKIKNRRIRSRRRDYVWKWGLDGKKYERNASTKKEWIIVKSLKKASERNFAESNWPASKSRANTNYPLYTTEFEEAAWKCSRRKKIKIKMNKK